MRAQRWFSSLLRKKWLNSHLQHIYRPIHTHIGSVGDCQSCLHPCICLFTPTGRRVDALCTTVLRSLNHNNVHLQREQSVFHDSATTLIIFQIHLHRTTSVSAVEFQTLTQLRIYCENTENALCGSDFIKMRHNLVLHAKTRRFIMLYWLWLENSRFHCNYPVFASIFCMNRIEMRRLIRDKNIGSPFVCSGFTTSSTWKNFPRNRTFFFGRAWKLVFHHLSPQFLPIYFIGFSSSRFYPCAIADMNFLPGCWLHRYTEHRDAETTSSTEINIIRTVFDFLIYAVVMKNYGIVSFIGAGRNSNLTIWLSENLFVFRLCNGMRKCCHINSVSDRCCEHVLASCMWAPSRWCYIR